MTKASIEIIRQNVRAVLRGDDPPHPMGMWCRNCGVVPARDCYYGDGDLCAVCLIRDGHDRAVENRSRWGR